MLSWEMWVALLIKILRLLSDISKIVNIPERLWWTNGLGSKHGHSTVNISQRLRRTFSGVIFANSNVPEKRFHILLNENEIMGLPEDSKDIFKQNMIDWYIDHPNIACFSGKYLILDSFCYAEFLRFYQVASNTKLTENEYQPEELSNELIEDIHNIDHVYPTLTSLMSSKEIFKCSKTP